MPKIHTPDADARPKLFHNTWINVYPRTLPLSEIEFWPENNRTMFTFERLAEIKGRKLKELSVEEITRFVAEQDIHKLQVLADSIGRNGVQVPLTIRDDGKLLDGNRRFFACQWLKMQLRERGKSEPETLAKIPVEIIRQTDLALDPTLELKILAEANFIPDLKVPWPLDAQARAVDEYYQRIRKDKKLDAESALIEVVSVFGIDRRRVQDLLDTLDLTKQFIDAAITAEQRTERRRIVEEKFVYLWEFRNKAMKGSGALAAGDLGEVRDFFFQMMAKGRDNPIKNVKQIEPIVQAKRDSAAWALLKESKGAKLPVVVSMMTEMKEIKKDEDKIQVFLGWLRTATSLTPRAKTLLKEVVKLATQKSQ